MSLVNIINIIPKEFLEFKIQIYEFPVGVGKRIDEFKRGCVLYSSITALISHIIAVLFGLNEVSFCPEFEQNNLPWLLEIHTPNRLSAFLVNWNQVIYYICLPSSVVINNGTIQSTGLELLSEK